MRIERIDKCRWRIGKTRLEYSLRFRRAVCGAFGLGFSRSIGGYDGDEKQTFLKIGYLSLWITRELGRYVEPEQRYGFELSSRVWQRWYGVQTMSSDTEQHVFFMWRDRLLDAVFGRTVCTTAYGPERKISVAMPEGDYPAVAKFEWRCWSRPRWPFHKMRLSTDVEIPRGIPFAGKGENSWDCGDDGLFGSGCGGHDYEKAAAKMREIVMDYRRKNGMPSERAIAESLSGANS